MKRVLLYIYFVLISLVGVSQNLNDRIYTKEGDSIICSITKFDGSWIYYDYSKKDVLKNTYIHMDDIKFYVNNGVKKKPYEYIPKNFTGVVNVDSTIMKSELYSVLMEWVAKNYVSAQNVLQYQDKEDGKIVVKGIISIFYKDVLNSSIEGRLYHTISFFVKNGKYKYIIDNIEFESTLKGSGRGDINSVKPVYGVTTKAWAEIQQKSNSEIETIIQSVNESVKKDKKGNDW